MCRQKGLAFVGSDREASILEPAAMRAFLSKTLHEGQQVTWIVNCAAYTAVDKAEDEKDFCRSLNTEGPGNIGLIATEIGASVLHISTDYVFSGESKKPYTETDPFCPMSVYGRTKADGELALRNTCAKSVIVRTAWLYGQHGPNFVATMLRLMNERDSVGVVADQYGSPTWARDLAGALLKIISSPNLAYGTYHYTNEGTTTWYEFACKIYRLGRTLGLVQHACDIQPLITAQYPAKAKRPQYSVLSKERIKESFHLTIPFWQESLHTYLEEHARGAAQ